MNEGIGKFPNTSCFGTTKIRLILLGSSFESQTFGHSGVISKITTMLCLHTVAKLKSSNGTPQRGLRRQEMEEMGFKDPLLRHAVVGVSLWVTEPSTPIPDP